MDISPLQKVRYAYQPKLPAILRESITKVAPPRREQLPVHNLTQIRSRHSFPTRTDFQEFRSYPERIPISARRETWE